MRVKLDFPPSPETKRNLRKLYALLKQEHPEVVERWKEIEGKPLNEFKPGDLDEVKNFLQRFLKEHCEWTELIQVISAAGYMRQFPNEEIGKVAGDDPDA